MSDVIARIRKLLKLAGNAGSEAEAALAAERAAELMRAHEIHEAQVSIDEPNMPRTPEPIEQKYQATDTKKKVAWHMRIAVAVCKSYGARAYWHGGRVMMFGRLSAVQAASYTCQYLFREVERITDSEAPTGTYSRSYRNAFRLGCAQRVGDRLYAAHKNQEARRAVAKPVAEPRVNIEDVEPPPPSAGVLAVIEKDHAEVEEEYKRYSKKWRKGRHVGQISSGSGYDAGQEAGDSINIRGGGRGGLPRGQGSLK